MEIKDLPGHDLMVATQALKALTQGRCLELDYDGLHRTVEVHTIGISKAGRPSMRVYQTKGHSLSAEQVGWKLMSLNKVFKRPVVTEIRSMAPREGYQRGDLGMPTIFGEV